MIHLDTSFLVDLLRETAAGKEGSASRLLEGMRDEKLGASVFVACELAAGAAMSREPVEEKKRVERIFQALQIDYPDQRFAAAYGSLLASLERGKGRIATKDLLIAVSAVLAGARLVTRNAKDFRRVPGLEVLSY